MRRIVEDRSLAHKIVPMAERVSVNPGVVFWGVFNTALEVTNTEKFCTGCHEMRDNVLQS